MPAIGPRKPTVIPRECQIELDELQDIAERSVTKFQFLQRLVIESHATSYEQKVFSLLMTKDLCEQAGQKDVFLWMKLEEFAKNASDHLLTLLHRGLYALALSARVAYEIWSSPAKTKSFQRESLMLLFQTQHFVECALDSIDFDGDYDQVLAKWWVWSNCESVGLSSQQLANTNMTDDWQIDSLISSLFRLRGAAGLANTGKDESGTENMEDGICPIL